MISSRRSIALPPDLLLFVLLTFPLAVSLAKLPVFPGAATIAGSISIADLPNNLRKIAEEIFFIPLGALVVVAFRLALGLRVLGLFRPILLALAFATIGVPLGLGILIPVLLFVLLLRPPLTNGHDYTRIAVLLSLVAVLLLLPLVVGTRWDLGWLQRSAHFPLIALCLTSESFAKTVDRDGIPEALWRALTTTFAAIVIVVLCRLTEAWELFLRFPELLLTQAGCVLLIQKHLNFRFWEGINPLIPRARRADPAQSTADSPLQGTATARQPLVGTVPISGEVG